MNHTPGPWKNKTFGEVKAKDDTFTVAQCMMGNLGEREANANLIAASPELLACLKNMVANEGYMSAEHMVDLAKLAIAKAEGVEP